MPNGGPPNKFPQFVDLTGITGPEQRADALGAAWQTFFDTFHIWPNTWVTVGEVVYLGAYGDEGHQ